MLLFSDFNYQSLAYTPKSNLPKSIFLVTVKSIIKGKKKIADLISSAKAWKFHLNMFWNLTQFTLNNWIHLFCSVCIHCCISVFFVTPTLLNAAIYSSRTSGFVSGYASFMIPKHASRRQRDNITSSSSVKGIIDDCLWPTTAENASFGFFKWLYHFVIRKTLISLQL